MAVGWLIKVEVLELGANEGGANGIEDVIDVLRVGGGGEVDKELVRVRLFFEVQVLDKLPRCLVVAVGALKKGRESWPGGKGGDVCV